MIVLITGVSSGFGRATAEELSKAGHKVYGTIRSDVKPIDGVTYLRVDVTDNDSIQNAISHIIEESGRIDVFINNAGMGIGGPIEFTDLDDAQKQMDVNFMGMVRCVKAVLPVMRKQSSGLIICLSSIGGLMGLPFQGFYSASKFAIEGFCEALRIEVKRYNIKIAVLNPGDFATGFTSKRKKTDNPLAEYAYPTYYESMKSIENDENGGLHPQVLARKVAKIVKKSNPSFRYIIASPIQKLSVFLKKLLPAPLFSKILGSYYKL